MQKKTKNYAHFLLLELGTEEERKSKEVTGRWKTTTGAKSVFVFVFYLVFCQSFSSSFAYQFQWHRLIPSSALIDYNNRIHSLRKTSLYPKLCMINQFSHHLNYKSYLHSLANKPCHLGIDLLLFIHVGLSIVINYLQNGAHGLLPVHDSRNTMTKNA